MSTHLNSFWRHSSATVALAVIAVASLPAKVTAQIPGVPVLQNAFANSGLAFAANFGGGSGQSFYGIAAGWGMGGRFTLSGGAGAQRMAGTTRGAYGARAAMSVWNSSSGALGAGGFVGLGGAPRVATSGVVTSGAVMNVPIGASVAYRRAMGSHGMSVYLSPMYEWTRADNGIVIKSGGTFAASAGLDFAVTSAIGATIGTQFGQANVSTPAGKSTGTLGLAVSFVPGGR